VDPMSSRDTSLAPDRLARLRGHLMTEITRQPEAPAATTPVTARRWTPRRVGLAATAVATATAAVFVGLTAGSGPGRLGPTAFAVTPEPDGVVAIHIVNTQASADEMTRQLRAKGLHIKVATMTASPSLVGTWLYNGATADVPASVQASVTNQRQGYAATIEVPASFPGTLTLGVGITPRPGQKVDVAGLRNALAPGGPLACRGLSGASPATAAKTLASLGYTIDYWTTKMPIFPANAPASRSGVVTEPPPGSRVTQVWVHDWSGQDITNTDLTREHHVIVQILPPDAPQYPFDVWLGFAPSLRTGDPATAGC
jgi:hypothetical protein